MKQLKDMPEINLIDDTQIEPEFDIIPVESDEKAHQNTDVKLNMWNMFESELTAIKTDNKSNKAVCVCKIDSDLAYTIDECRINGASRSDMVNAILRAFITQHLPDLSIHRKIKKTLLDKI